jgi:hypothetical protein
MLCTKKILLDGRSWTSAGKISSEEQIYLNPSSNSGLSLFHLPQCPFSDLNVSLSPAPLLQVTSENDDLSDVLARRIISRIGEIFSSEIRRRGFPREPRSFHSSRSHDNRYQRKRVCSRCSGECSYATPTPNADKLTGSAHNAGSTLFRRIVPAPYLDYRINHAADFVSI